MSKLKNKSFEAYYYDMLKEIAAYSNPDKLRKRCRTEYGLGYTEGLEMAYVNAVETARLAIKGKLRPSTQSKEKTK
jgi:hypothetical protein